MTAPHADTTASSYTKKQLARGILIWGTGLLFLLFQFILQLSSGVIIDQLTESFSLSAFDAGLLSGAFYYVYVFMQVPAGLLIDRYGARRLLILGSFVNIIGCAVFANASELYIAEIGRLLMGGGCSFAFVGTIFFVSKWFPLKYFALLVGLMETVGMLGSMWGDIYFAHSAAEWGWRLTMHGATAIAVVVSVLSILILRDTPQHKNYTHPDLRKREFLTGLWAVTQKPQAWFNALYCGVMFSTITIFVALWGIPFIKTAYGVSVTTATTANMMVFLGAAIGCPIMGWLSDVYQRRKPGLMIGAIGSLIMLSLIIYKPMSIQALFIAMLGLGITSGSYVLPMAIARDILPVRYSSTGIGFTNALSLIPAPVFQPLVGLLLDKLAADRVMPIGGYYTVEEFQTALIVMPALMIGGVILALLIKESHPARVSVK